MRFTTAAVIIASAGFAAAQSSDSTLTSVASSVAGVSSSTATASVSSGCDAENIVKACIGSTQGQIDACSQTDYKCLCAAYQAQLTCYNNCPNDPGRSTPQSFVTSYCQAASAASSQSKATETGKQTSSSSATASSSESTSSGSASTSSSMNTATLGSSSSGSAASASASSTGLANAVVVPAAGSMLAIVMGVFGML